MRVNLPKRVTLKKQRDDLRKQGVLWPLPMTSIGDDRDEDDLDGAGETYEIHMRYISTFDRAIVDAMPQEAQEQVWSGIQSIQNASRGAKSPDSLVSLAAQNEKQVNAARLLFCAAAINPRVYMTEEEADEDPMGYYVGDFANEDVVSYFMATIGGNAELARRMKLFRPERRDDAQDSNVRRLDAEGTVRDMEPSGALD